MRKSIEIITASPEETIMLGEKIGARLKGGDCIAYKGGLGAGKTTVTRGISIALVNEYRGSKLSLCHFDMYRITSPDDLETTGFYDYMDDNTVIAVEWSENIEEELPENSIIIEIRRTGENTRKFIITGDERFDDIGN